MFPFDEYYSIIIDLFKNFLGIKEKNTIMTKLQKYFLFIFINFTKFRSKLLEIMALVISVLPHHSL